MNDELHRMGSPNYSALDSSGEADVIAAGNLAGTGQARKLRLDTTSTNAGRYTSLHTWCF